MTLSHAAWIAHFLPEGRANVARRIELGEHVSDPESAARIYANFAAFDAIHRGKTEVDFARARDAADILDRSDRNRGMGKRRAA